LWGTEGTPNTVGSLTLGGGGGKDGYHNSIGSRKQNKVYLDFNSHNASGFHQYYSQHFVHSLTTS